MPLSSEDSLRLNVLLASCPQAIRINEASMMVFGLSEKGETEIILNPTCRDNQYIKQVKELISGHVLGSPGGYPVFLQRWTRMGQMRDESLEQLLLLGEPEAVVAAASTQGLSNELARRAWWAMEDAQNARDMLGCQQVVEGDMGPVLARYLLEFLPFETEPEQMVETVQLILQPGLISREELLALWKKGQRKNAYYVGFMTRLPFQLPVERASHPDFSELDSGHEYLNALHRLVLSAAGQAYIETLLLVLKKPSNQELVNLILDLVAGYFSVVRPEGRVDKTLDALEGDADDWLKGLPQDQLSEQSAQRLRSMRILSGLSYGVVRPAFKDSTAIGSLMRRKLEPVMLPLGRIIQQLQG